MSAIPPVLSITELAERTGVPAPTLRSWETRYGRPRAERRPGGHRRYTDDDVELVHRILRLRAGGLSLPAAIDQAADHGVQVEMSLFAGLRRRHPELSAQVLSKATLLALTRAIEDECCARAEQPALFAVFQRESFYGQAQHRWRELSRTARVAVAFADFGAPEVRGQDPITVCIPADAPLLREWAVVCDSPTQAACVAGWELPGQYGVPDSERRFEAVWTVDARVVRDAARICSDLAVSLDPTLEPRLSTALLGNPPAPSADLDRAGGLLTRTVAYLEGARRP